ncbi:MAG: hypothetical protein KAS63_05725 [Candidatus Heimdallarchaeota archaeon]|nr:hypothetical protein [Candidatus Heimdallarchaeota archaeon]MCK4954838.1 hypothetical protein [Candidatus Heimdallarchaeota archaeon]
MVNVLLISAELSRNQFTDEEMKEGIIFAQKRIRELENNLLFLSELFDKSLFILYKQLKKKQRQIFFSAFRIILEEDSTSINKISNLLSKNLELSFSTIKWNLTKLRDLGLFETYGERGNTKTTLLITELGETLYSTFAYSDIMK